MRSRTNSRSGEALDNLKADLSEFSRSDLELLNEQLGTIQKDLGALATALGNAGAGKAGAFAESLRDSVAEATGGLRQGAAKATRRGEEAAHDIEEMIGRHPLTSLLVAAGVGFLAGSTLRRR